VVNQYKRMDIFQCSQDAHRHFGGRVSVHHVLKEKQCYPQGCLYFLWHCVLLEKGRRCVKGYTHAGKNCTGCTHFMDEKIHLQPSRVAGPDAYARFLEDLEGFENWLERVCYRRSSVLGRIAAVKPWFEKRLGSGGNRTVLRGYLLAFKKGFIGTEPFDDTFYVRVGDSLMQQIRFVPKMKVELTGEIRLDHGRLVVHHPGRVDVLAKGWGFPWTRERALVAARTATRFDEQPESCLDCPWGSLVDTLDFTGPDERRFRNLYCLKSVTDPDGCYVRHMRRLRNMGTTTEPSHTN